MCAPASPIYYGWLVLAASAVPELLAQGVTSYAAGLFVLPLQAEFHISRANANSAILILFLGAAVIAPLVGKILDRYPIHLVISLDFALPTAAGPIAAKFGAYSLPPLWAGLTQWG